MNTKLIIFGMTGDLSQRKLLPALRDIVETGEYGNLSIIGVSRRDVSVEEILGEVSELADRTTVFRMDLADPNDYRRLNESIHLSSDEQALFYLSVPPSAAADIVDFLGQAGLNTPNVKILFEKPFGFDLESATDFLERTGRYFKEEQLYRIDHYMAKEVTQHILRLRSNAESHHHDWGFLTVERIDVVASEKIGVEGRGVFYEQTGALRDFLQGHLLQLLSLVLMTMSDEPLSTRRLKALQQLETANPESAHRAQYEGYQDEVQNSGSLTETFASLELSSSQQRWRGVPIRLITGKKLNEKRSYIEVIYKDGTTDVFEEGKIPVDGRLKDAYERVLVDAIASRKDIFTTGPEVLRAWEIVARVQEAWSMDNSPLSQYKPGTPFEDILS